MDAPRALVACLLLGSIVAGFVGPVFQSRLHNASAQITVSPTTITTGTTWTATLPDASSSYVILGFMVVFPIVMAVAAGYVWKKKRASTFYARTGTSMPTASLGTATKFCRYCGARIAQDSAFCEKCGKRL